MLPVWGWRALCQDHSCWLVQKENNSQRTPCLLKVQQMGRKRKASPPKKDVDLKSPLAVLLLKRWSVGDIPAVLIQEIADAAVKSGCKEPYVLVLQSLGSNGQQPGNIHRDLKIKFFKNMVAPEPTLCRQPSSKRPAMVLTRNCQDKFLYFFQINGCQLYWRATLKMYWGWKVCPSFGKSS